MTLPINAVPPVNPAPNLPLSRRATWPTEQSAAMTGSTILIATLTYWPAILIFDNQSTSSIAIYVNQTTNIWRTFPAGEALVLDLRANHGIADIFTSDLNTTFYGNGTNLSGNFSISAVGILTT